MRLFPKNYDFFKMFDEQAENLHKAVKVLRELEDGKDLNKLSRKMEKIEHAADDITHQIIETLNKTFITPIEREDIAALASDIDDVIDEINKALSRLVIYEIKKIPNEVYKYFDAIEDAISGIARALEKLAKPKHRSEVLKICSEINHIENKADEIHRHTLAKLLNYSKDAMMAIKLKDIYESLEKVTDFCENVANSLETIIVKNF